MNDFYVYLLIDPRTNEPFYVGKGTGDRWKAHLVESHKPVTQQSNPYKCNVIRQIQKSGREIECKILPMVSEQEAYDEECRLIRLYGKQVDGSGILTNLQDGGRHGRISRPVTVFLSKDGSFVGYYTSVSLAASALGIRCSDISLCLSNKQKTSKGFIFRDGTYSAANVIPYNRNIEVDVYEIQNTNVRFLKTFNSITTATKYLKVSQTLTYNALVGKQKTIHDRYIVCYAGKSPQLFNLTYVEAFDPHTKKLKKTFKSLADATHTTGIDRSSILRSIRTHKTAGGFVWKKRNVSLVIT